jgi:hypothetical protein
MKFKLFAVLALAATPLFASPDLFSKYEAVRQGLLKTSLKDTQATAKQLATAARAAKNETVAKQADAVAAAKDLAGARAAFGTLSEEMIKVRNAAKGDRPAVAFCPMVNKSWLQSAKAEIGNPYDSAMAQCGMIKKD